jgi:hypothetical protein
MHIQLSEYLRCIQKVLVLEDPSHGISRLLEGLDLSWLHTFCR